MNKDRLIWTSVSLTLAAIFFGAAAWDSLHRHAWSSIASFCAGFGIAILIVGPAALWKYRAGLALLFKR